MSDGGARTFCAVHWKRVLDARPIANPVAATVLLTQRFVAKVDTEIPAGATSEEAVAQMNAMLRARAPFCCYLGDEAVTEVIVMAQAAESGALA